MPPAAVFLSYASQDTDAAKKICEALRAVGVEVWFDQNELVGGDAWDAKIRKQIKDCTLFVPIISANTQARTEGYFRLEWRLADQRTHLMAKGRPFLLPVVIDDTRDADAHVPDSFTEVQWTRLRGGETPEKFCERVKRLLAGENVSPNSRRDSADPSRPQTTPTKTSSALTRLALGALAVLVLGVVAYLALRPRRSPEEIAKLVANAQTVATNAAAKTSPAAAEFARIRANFVPDRWQKGDFEALSPTLDRLIQTDPENSDVWALRSIINSMQVSRNIDSGTKPLEIGKAAADRALRLAPDSPLAELALGLHLSAMISRGGDPTAGRPHVSHAVAAMPPDALTRYADLVAAWQIYETEETKRIATAWLAAEPNASYPNWILAQRALTLRQPTEAEKWAEAAAADRNITGTRALYTQFESKYYLRADLAAAKETLARVSPEGRTVHRIIHARWLLAMAEQHWDEALQELSRTPEPMLYDRTYHGPRALLAGLAHQRAGRADAALAQFREAERLLKSELATDAENEELHLVLALTLACAGRAADARSEIGLVEPLLKGRAPSIYWGAQVVTIAQTYGVLGEPGHMAEWLRKLFVLPNGFPFTPASLRMDPRLAGMLDAPEMQALLKEFASLDQPKESVTAIAPDQKSVAVLAFADNSPAHDSEYFSDGISEELINALGKVPGLKVPARTSSFYFKGKSVPVPEIAKQLGVAYVIEGSVQRVGERVKISARLTKAADGFQVWADSFPREAKDVFAVEEEIAGIIAKQLSLKLGVSSTAATVSVKPEAFELYVRARQEWNLRAKENLTRAEDLLNRALELEPNFSRALAALADVWLIRDQAAGVIGYYRQRNAPPPELVRSVEKIDRALALDPDSAEAHASLGLTRLLGGRLDDAELELRRAIALNPNYASAHQWLGQTLLDSAHIDESIAELKLAAELDPLAPRILQNWAFVLRLAGRLSESLEVVDRSLRVQPTSGYGLQKKAEILLALHRMDEAVLIARTLQTHADTAGACAMIFARAGLKAEAEAELPKARDSDWYRADALHALGRRDEAIAVFEVRGLPVFWLGQLFFYDDLGDSIRNDPRIVKLFSEAGVTEANARAQAWRAVHPAEKK